MPNVMGREFPYTPEGMAAAEQYKQSVGMRDGGSMGFRPVGYAYGSPGVPVGDEIGVNSLVATGMGRRAAESGDMGLKEGLIEKIMQITGMTDVGTLLEMSVPDLQNALSGLLGNEQGMPSTEQGMMPPGQMMGPPPEMAPPPDMMQPQYDSTMGPGAGVSAGMVPQPSPADISPRSVPISDYEATMMDNRNKLPGGGYRNGGLASLRRY